jgi:hypothetical protein
MNSPHPELRFLPNKNLHKTRGPYPPDYSFDIRGPYSGKDYSAVTAIEFIRGLKARFPQPENRLPGI